MVTKAIKARATTTGSKTMAATKVMATTTMEGMTTTMVDMTTTTEEETIRVDLTRAGKMEKAKRTETLAIGLKLPTSRSHMMQIKRPRSRRR